MADQLPDPKDAQAPSEATPERSAPETSTPSSQPEAQDRGQSEDNASGEAGPADQENGPPQQGQFRARPASVADKPRRVRAGRKLNPANWPERLGWAGRSWLRAAESCASAEQWKEGVDYAERGQTRRLETEVGLVSADIQGRPYRPYTTELRVKPFSHDEWEAIIRELVKESIYAASLLNGEMPEAIQTDVLDRLGLSLVPQTPEEFEPSCNCKVEEAWCKHVCCAAMQLAEDIDADPFVLFRLRGLEGEDVLEKLRQRRELEASGGSAPSSALRLPFPGDERAAPAMEHSIEEFWQQPAGLDELETTPKRPEVRHALLRRLGPSPFEEGKFPLAGLLATCYDTISEAAIETAKQVAASDAGEGEPTSEPDEAPQDTGPKLSAAQLMLKKKLAAKGGAVRAKPKG